MGWGIIECSSCVCVEGLVGGECSSVCVKGLVGMLYELRSW